MKLVFLLLLALVPGLPCSHALALRCAPGPPASIFAQSPSTGVDVRGLLRRVSQEKDAVDQEVFAAIAGSGDPGAFKALKQTVTFLSDRWPLTAAYRAFGAFEGTPNQKNSRKFLLDAALRHRRSINRVAATASLARLGANAAAELDKIVARAQDREARSTAVRALLPVYAERADLASAEAVLEYATPNGRNTTAIRRALQKLRGSKILRLYSGYLKDPEFSSAWRFLLLDVLSGWQDRGACALIAGMIRSEDEVLAAKAVEILGKSGYSHFVREIEPLVRSGPAAVLREALIAVTRLTDGDPYWLEDVLEYSRSKHPAIRMGAAVALLEIRTEGAIDRLLEMLDDEDWRVRVEVVEQVGLLHRLRAVPLLIERIDGETPRIARDMHLALRLLTGVDHGPRSARWRAWWHGEGENFQQPKATATRTAEIARQKRKKKSTTRGTFYGLQVLSERVVFVVDRSGSMNGRAMLPKGPERKKPEASTRFEVARDQILSVLPSLSDKTLFNLAFFGSRIFPWEDGLVRLDEKNLKRALKHVGRAPMGGGTNVWAGLMFAFDDPRVDTVFLLTDGQPSNGVVIDTQEIRARIERLNRTRKVVIHCVSVGRKSRFLRLLAKENGGLYTEAL
ncbi:MAG TPA: VWA domain-containing protein [Planctomycetes bacterium]|nr:VWA domain-containing protein [Planctomycetota bacterium]HIL37927.1 VWA domain-containing protein [Planctomycetota bacterium]